MNDVAKNQSGYSLVELIVVMAVSMVVVSGLFSTYLLELRVNSSQTDITERLGDLRMASQLMRRELRMAKDVDCETTKKIKYNTVDGEIGRFEYQYDDEKDQIYWLRHDDTVANNYQELIRNLDEEKGLECLGPDSDGLIVITLKLPYTKIDKTKTGNLELSFKIRPRNI